MHRNHSVVLFYGWCVRAERSGVGVLELELFDALSDSIHAEDDFALFVSRSEESNMSIFRNLVELSEASANSLDALFYFNAKVLSAKEEAVFLYQMLEMRVVLVDVTESVEGAVLSDVLRGEFEPIRGLGLQVVRVVSKVNILQSPLLQVLLEPGEEVALRHDACGLLVSFFK